MLMQGPRGFKKLGRHTGIYRTHSRMQRVYQGLKMRHSVVSGCHIAGIDLGTSNSLISVVKSPSEVEVLPDSIGDTALPSVVAYKTTDEGVKVRVGKEALEVPDSKDCVVVPSIKMILGRNLTKASESAKAQGVEVEGSKHHDDSVVIKIPNQETVSATSVASEIIKCLLSRATDGGMNVSRAVLTIPANAEKGQRLSTIEAGRVAGISNMALLQEPVAAAFAHGSSWLEDEHQVIAVVDVGAGTCDISFVESWSGCLEVIETGAVSVGGRDFDSKMGALIKAKAPEIELSDNKLSRLAEKAKIELSQAPEVAIPLEGGHTITISREEFNHSIETLLSVIKETYQHLAKTAGVAVPAAGIEGPLVVSRLVMVGGSSLVPAVLALATKLTAQTPDQTLPPMEVVARGASIYGGILAGEITGGMELNDGGFMKDVHGQVAAQGFPFS